MQRKRKKKDTITDSSLLKYVIKRDCLYYKDVNKIYGDDHYNYEDMKFEYGLVLIVTVYLFIRSTEPYEIKEKLGRGSYSEVFDGINIYNGKRCCIKILKPGIVYPRHELIKCL